MNRHPGIHRVIVALFLILGVSQPGFAKKKNDPPPGCYDFSKVIKTPFLNSRKMLPKAGSVHGDKDKGINWGAARKVINVPIEQIYAQFLDHEIVKDMSKTKVRYEALQNPGWTAYHHVWISVRVVAFIKVSWEEEWGYRILKGTPKKPKKIHIFYQKVKGTSHLKHLCGYFEVTRLSPTRTELFLYEQVKATRRNAEDTEKMHLGTLDKLLAAKK